MMFCTTSAESIYTYTGTGPAKPATSGAMRALLTTRPSACPVVADCTVQDTVSHKSQRASASPKADFTEAGTSATDGIPVAVFSVSLSAIGIANSSPQRLPIGTAAAEMRSSTNKSERALSKVFISLFFISQRIHVFPSAYPSRRKSKAANTSSLLTRQSSLTRPTSSNKVKLICPPTFFLSCCI